jgi:hypothetical protein
MTGFTISRAAPRSTVHGLLLGGAPAVAEWPAEVVSPASAPSLGFAFLYMSPAEKREAINDHNAEMQDIADEQTRLYQAVKKSYAPPAIEGGQ